MCVFFFPHTQLSLFAQPVSHIQFVLLVSVSDSQHKAICGNYRWWRILHFTKPVISTKEKMRIGLTTGMTFLNEFGNSLAPPLLRLTRRLDPAPSLNQGILNTMQIFIPRRCTLHSLRASGQEKTKTSPFLSPILAISNILAHFSPLFLVSLYFFFFVSSHFPVLYHVQSAFTASANYLNAQQLCLQRLLSNCQKGQKRQKNKKRTPFLSLIFFEAVFFFFFFLNILALVSTWLSQTMSLERSD